jgi:hypothetical protein
MLNLKTFESFANNFAQDKVRCSTADGASDRSWTLEKGWIGGKDDHKVVFVVPSGFHRLTYAFDITKDGINAGGSVNWTTNDAHDGTINVHMWADAFSKVTIKVYDVFAIKEG